MNLRRMALVPLIFSLAPLCSAQNPAGKQPDTGSVSTALPTVDEPIAKLIGTFFDLLAKNQIDKAYENLIHGTKIAEQSKDVATLRSKTQQAIQFFGEVRGHELVSVKNLGTHLLAATYLSFGKDFPLRWRFYFYRSDGPWKLIDIRVDDRLMDMFDDKPAPQQP